jgi:hypothetical protein
MGRDYSPFTPGIPVKPESFAGKRDEIEQLIGRCKSAATGNFERTYVIGERGIGKSSLCSFVREYADTKLEMLTAHVFLGGASTVEEMCRRVFDRLVGDNVKRSWFDSLRGLLGKHVKEVGLFGVSVGFDATEQELKQLAAHLPMELHALLEKLGKTRQGMLLILDDINGLADTPDFAHWLKSFVDSVATSGQRLPMHVMLASTDERRDRLLSHQPSLNRAFSLHKTGTVASADAAQFFVERMSESGIKIEPEALTNMVEWAGGYPVLLQEVGDGVFRANTDDTISAADVTVGAHIAAQSVGEKYLDKSVVATMQSAAYRSILGTIVQNFVPGVVFSRKEIGEVVKADDKGKLDNFLQKMKELGVLSSPRNGEYQFANSLHWMYYLQRAAELVAPPSQRK